MRFISINNVTEGMIVGKPLYGRAGHLLIQSGTELTQSVILKLKITGYRGLYIKDTFSEGIAPEDVISDKTRHEAAESVRKFIENTVTEKSKYFQSDLKEISNVINKIIDEIMRSGSSVINVIDMKNFDEYTYEHSVNVCVLACFIGIGCDMPQTELYKLGLAAILHDIGKMFIDEKILNKPDRLTAEEFEIIKTHSTIGVEMLNLNNDLPPTVTASILQHHEKYDGSGYPFGKAGKEIPVYAQIISMVDVYDAITTNRPYRSPISSSEAYEYISGNSGQAFNPELVQVFLRKITPFPLGVQVLLSNGQTGIVCKNYESHLLRPLVKIIPTEENPTPGVIDLRSDTDSYNITIKKIFM
ncbi:MAG: HD-GYP domain-containing protein [Oscillospiraceae bacterium]|nr:HD-GYP domain-containing protein [Oscillospiraceae bacterium]